MSDVRVASAGGDGLRLERVMGGRKESDLMRFRHRIFRERLRWLPESVDGLDRDEYDSFSDNFAVTCRGKVVGSVRLTPGTQAFMMEREFLPLLPQGVLLEKGPCSAEITRFAVGDVQPGRRATAVSSRLYACLYLWARQRGVRWMYFVVEPQFFRHIRRLGFPARPLGPARPLDGGVWSLAGVLDWTRADPTFIRWLRSVSAIPVEAPVQSRASDCWRSTCE